MDFNIDVHPLLFQIGTYSKGHVTKKCPLTPLPGRITVLAATLHFHHGPAWDRLGTAYETATEVLTEVL